ncbi:MAG: signal recognition particle protein [Deltaproteobacteria bacterium]|nr:signal recognition particle protein [Deltaproteobacteria bacterium]
MLEALSKGFRTAKQHLAGEAELNEKNISEALRDVRMSLLEADVEFRVTKAFLKRVKEKALGEVVRLKVKHKGKRKKLAPGEHFVKICQNELVQLMGPVDTSITFAKRGPTGIMLVGLQGSGKTTTIAKLARLLEKEGKKPLLVAADVYRPAAIEQLQALGEQLKLPVYSEVGQDPVDICERAVKFAATKGRDVVLMDTAGRLAIDEPLMQELVNIKGKVKPANVFLVIDAMIGQDAVGTAKEFDKRLDLSGVILTKLDGDARGGAALSIKEVTGKPIKFVGMGESLDRLEEFRPEGIASRILGLGDVVGLVKDFEDVVDAEQAEKDAERMLRGHFNMQDFLEQIKLLKKMGSLTDLIDKLPFFPDGLPNDIVVDDRELGKIEAIIHSMTKQERQNPEVFVITSFEEIKDKKGRKKGRRAVSDYELGRVRRVARGAGRKEGDVKDLLVKFATMRQFMMLMGAQQGLLGKIPGMKNLARLKQFAGMDMEQMFKGIARFQNASGQVNQPHPKETRTGYGRSASREKMKRKRKQARKDRKRTKKRK